MNDSADNETQLLPEWIWKPIPELEQILAQQGPNFNSATRVGSARLDSARLDSARVDSARVEAAREAFRRRFLHAQWRELLEIFRELRPHAAASAVSLDASGPVVSIGRAGDLSEHGQSLMRKAVLLLRPWRKGPFDLFGVAVDAEWRSDMKWSRIAPELGSLEGKCVLDVGCNSGYYMLRALTGNPRLVVGIDPSERFALTFALLQLFARDARMTFEPIGVEKVELFGPCFDLVLCLGIIYHQRDPLEMLRRLKRAMSPGATLILESQGIPGDDPVALFADDRYAKARNTYFVPTGRCLEAWLVRAGFRDVRLFSSVETTVAEQRPTEWAPGESLSDFLDPRDSRFTVEGHPAPLRIAARATS